MLARPPLLTTPKTLADLLQQPGGGIGDPSNQGPLVQQVGGGGFNEQGPSLAGVDPSASPTLPHPSAPSSGVPATTAPSSGSGTMTFEQANDPAYIDSQIRAGFQQRYGRDPTDAELQQWRGYAGPDTYSDGQQRSGWNPYLMDRLVNPNSSGGSAVDPGSYTLIPGAARAGTGGAGAMGAMGGGFGMSEGIAGRQSGNPLVPSNLLAPWTQQFQAPDPNAVRNDPAYQFQLKEGQNAIDRSAAAKGTLVSGGTLKDMAEFGQGLASNFEDKAYNRAIGEYGMNQNTFRANETDPYNKLLGYGAQGLAGSQALAGYGNQYGNATQANANEAGALATGQGNAAGAGAIAKANLSSGTLADLAKNLSDVDWASIFGPKPKPAYA